MKPPPPAPPCAPYEVVEYPPPKSEDGQSVSGIQGRTLDSPIVTYYLVFLKRKFEDVDVIFYLRLHIKEDDGSLLMDL